MKTTQQSEEPPFLTKHNKDDPRDQSGFFFDDPRGTIASFNAPMGIDIDSEGNIYVADLFNDRIRKITPRSEVTTAIGPRYGTSTIPLSGHFDESAALALLTHPTAVDVDSKGDIYVVDVFDTNESHSMVRKLSGGMVSTVADYSAVSFPHSYSGMKHFSKRGLEADWPDKIWVKASTQKSVGIYSIDKNDGASMEVLSENTNSPMTDLQMTGNRIFATRYGGDIVEIKMENGVYTETMLIPVADIMTVLPQGVSIHSTALAVTEDGNTFYVAAFADNSLGYIIRVDYNSSSGSYTKTMILDAFDTTGTLLTEEQATAYIDNGQYFISDQYYFPVRTFKEVQLGDVYGLALDGDGHLIVSDFSNNLILKVFNPHL